MISSMQKILIVEDDVFLKELYTDILTQAKYEVDTAIDGDQALSKMKSGGWDLILLDVMLPKHTGFEVMEELQNDPQFKKTCPIVFFTNLDDPKEKVLAEKLGDAYIIKSQLSPPEFLEVIKGHLK